MNCASTVIDEQRLGWGEAASLNGKCAQRQLLPPLIKAISPKNSSGWYELFFNFDDQESRSPRMRRQMTWRKADPFRLFREQ